MLTVEQIALRDRCKEIANSLSSSKKEDLFNKYNPVFLNCSQDIISDVQKCIEIENKHREEIFLQFIKKDSNDEQYEPQTDYYVGLLKRKLESHIPSLVYLELSSEYSEVEKLLIGQYHICNETKLFSQSWNREGVYFNMFCEEQKNLYDKVIKDPYFEILKGTYSILPASAHLTSLKKYINVETNHYIELKSSLYGHNEYYYCLIGLVKKQGQLFFYHWNPRRLTDGKQFSGLTIEDEVQGADYILFIVHPASKLSTEELNFLEVSKIKYDFLNLPVGRKSISLTYDARNDVLTVNNLEAKQTLVFYDVLDMPSKKNLNCTSYFIALLNKGFPPNEAFQKTLDSYYPSRGNLFSSSPNLDNLKQKLVSSPKQLDEIFMDRNLNRLVVLYNRYQHMYKEILDLSVTNPLLFDSNVEDDQTFRP